MHNGFKLKFSNKTDQEKELLSKLEEPTKKGVSKIKSFTVTPMGISLAKGEELGMYEMGSTVALIFECPKDYHIQLADGEAVMLGQKLLEKI